jgi:hypothetical protein
VDEMTRKMRIRYPGEPHRKIKSKHLDPQNLGTNNPPSQRKAVPVFLQENVFQQMLENNGVL